MEVRLLFLSTFHSFLLFLFSSAAFLPSSFLGSLLPLLLCLSLSPHLIDPPLHTDAGSDEDGEGEPNSGSDLDAGSNSDSDADGAAAAADSDDEAVFESADALTTVSVAPLSFSRSPTPEPLVSAAAAARVPKEEKVQEGSKYKKRVRNTVQARPKLTRKDRKEIVTGGKKVKKKMLTRMKGTKARSAR